VSGGGKKNDLRIEDLGYFKLARFKAIQQAESFYLSRLKFGITVYTMEQGVYKEIDLLKITQKLRAGKQLVLEVYLGKEEKLPARLIVEKVPAEIAKEKRRKLKTDKQNKRKNLSEARLLFCDMNAYITNTTEEQLPANDIRKYYSLRWQIEIIFKAWKTVYRIDQIKQMKIQRFESIHYGALILIVLTNRLLAFFKAIFYVKKNKEISELKFFKTTKLVLIELRISLLDPAKTFFEFLSLLSAQVEKTCLKERKRTRLTPFLIIRPNP